MLKTFTFAFASLTLATGCIELPSAKVDLEDTDRPRTDLDEDTEDSEPPALPPGGGLGEDCSEDDPCRSGLVCEDEICVAEGATALGDECLLSIECAEGQCVDGRCVPYGEGDVGARCLSSAECGAGLRCGVVSFSTQCVPEGDVDLGGECADSSDCLSGLTCVWSDDAGHSICSSIPGAPPGVPRVWRGVDCAKPSDERVQAYFEIPGAPGADEGDFFRLPFPNDVRTDSRGRVDVADFPTPGPNPIVGQDPIRPYVDAVNGSQGWGSNGTVTFRFSGPIDLGSLKVERGVQWVDITDPEAPRGAGISYRTTSGRTNYVCHNALSVRRANGSPMLPGHTYAVWINAAASSGAGESIGRSANFASLLRDAAPSDAILRAAHAKFAPFRAYLEAQAIDPDEVLVATVITVGPLRELMTDLAAAVRATDVPEATDWVRCGGGVESPCPQAEEGRACGESTSEFDEYHALVSLPIFQQGEPPYLEQGGKIQTNRPVRDEAVCLALSIPKGSEMPETGWPLVVFTHGTGGSFRSHLTNPAVARELSRARTPDGVVRFAVLGFDQVQHGPRRGASDESPDNLFFNFLNPDAAQGNPLQGAADVISIGRFASALDLPASATGADAIRIDPARLVYFGHSQGSMAGSLALPYAEEFRGTVLSGNGASLLHALLTKTEPVNIAAVVPLVINDGVSVDLRRGTVAGALPDGDHNPVLSLVQRHIDPADPMNFGQQLTRDPLEGQRPKHVFATFGLEDTFSPPVTLEIFALAAGLDFVDPHSSANDPEPFGNEASEFPLRSSFVFDDVEYTTGVRLYGPPSGSDGHFVVFDVQDATRDAARFLGMAASGATPQIGE